MHDRRLWRVARFVSREMGHEHRCRAIVVAAAVLTGTMVNPGAAQTQADYPTKPIR